MEMGIQIKPTPLLPENTRNHVTSDPSIAMVENNPTFSAKKNIMIHPSLVQHSYASDFLVPCWLGIRLDWLGLMAVNIERPNKACVWFLYATFMTRHTRRGGKIMARPILWSTRGSRFRKLVILSMFFSSKLSFFFLTISSHFTKTQGTPRDILTSICSCQGCWVYVDVPAKDKIGLALQKWFRPNINVPSPAKDKSMPGKARQF